jgi:hypothetical protein
MLNSKMEMKVKIDYIILVEALGKEEEIMLL